MVLSLAPYDFPSPQSNVFSDSVQQQRTDIWLAVIVCIIGVVSLQAVLNDWKIEITQRSYS